MGQWVLEVWTLSRLVFLGKPECTRRVCTQLCHEDRVRFCGGCLLMGDMACPTGIEPVTHSLEGCCSIQLSYGQFQKTKKALTGL